MTNTLKVFVVLLGFLLGEGSLFGQSKTMIFPRAGQAPVSVIPTDRFQQWPFWIPYLDSTGEIKYQRNPNIQYDVKYQNIEDFQMGVSFTNSGTSPAKISLTAYGEDGKLIAGEDLTNPANFLPDDKLLLPGTQERRYMYQIFGKGILQKKAWVKVVCEGGDVKGMAFPYTNNFDVMSGSAPLDPANASTKILFPTVCRRIESGRYSYRTELDIINNNNTTANIRINQWYQQSGNDVDYINGGLYAMWHTQQIPPYGKLQAEWFFEDIHTSGGIPVAPVENNYLVAISDIPVLGSQTILYNYEPVAGTIRQTSHIAAVNAMSLEEGAHKSDSDGGFLSDSIPHILQGSGWSTKLIYINGRSEFYLWNSDGSPVNANNYLRSIHTVIGTAMDLKKQFDLSSILNSTADFSGSLSYWMYDKPIENSMLNWVEFDSTENEGLRAIVPLSTTTTSAVFPHVAEGEFAPGESFGTGFAIKDSRWSIYGCDVCVDNKPNHIVLELHDSDGTLLDTADLYINPAGKVAKVTPELFPHATYPRFGGYVTAKSLSGKPFVALGMYWKVKDGVIVSLAMIPQQ